MVNDGQVWQVEAEPSLLKHQVWSLTQFYSVDFLTIRDQFKQVRFQQTHNQCLRQLLLTVSWDLRA